MGTQGIRVCARAAACLCLALTCQASAGGIESIGGEEAPIVTGSGNGGASMAADRSRGRLIPDEVTARPADLLSHARAAELTGAASWPTESMRVPLDRPSFPAIAPAIPGAFIAQADMGLGREGSFAATPTRLVSAAGGHSGGAMRQLTAAAIGLLAVTLLGSAVVALAWRRSP